jgi:hypothetical protein
LKGTHPGTIYARFGSYIDASTNKYGRQWQFLFLIGCCLKKSSPLKLLGKMESNLAGSIYARSSIKLHLVPFGRIAHLTIMILKQISKGDNHYLKKQQPS